MRSAYARNPARRDFPAFGNERRKQPHFLVIDIVDLVDAEPAHLFAPEILLLARNRFVAAGRTLRAANRSSTFLFSHGYPFVSSTATGTGAAGAGCSTATGAGAPGNPGAA